MGKSLNRRGKYSHCTRAQKTVEINQLKKTKWQQNNYIAQIIFIDLVLVILVLDCLTKMALPRLLEEKIFALYTV